VGLKLLSYFTVATRGMSDQASPASQSIEQFLGVDNSNQAPSNTEEVNEVVNEVVNEGVEDQEEQEQPEEQAQEGQDIEEYVDDDAVVSIENETYDREKVLELGDRILIDSKEYGRVWGSVYYRDNTLLRLKPDSAGNILYDFPRRYDPEERIDEFEESLGVEASYILKKRKSEYPDFVRQQDFQVGQTLAGILPNGKAGPFYRITKVNEEEDRIKMVNLDDEEDKVTLKFKFRGIPLDAPFRILRIAAPPGTDLKGEQEKALEAAAAAEGVPDEVFQEEEIEQKGDEEGDSDLEFQPDEEYEVIAERKVVLPKQRVLKAAITSRIIIPEALQKADAVNDFLNMMDITSQKDTKAIRECRVLVETLQAMKREITDYNEDGTIKGVKSPSVNTLLELLQKVDVPMGRAILDIEKRLYWPWNIQRSYDEPDETNNQKQQYFMVEDDMTKPLLTIADATGASAGVKSPLASAYIDTGAGSSNQIKHYVDEQMRYEREERPWVPGTGTGPEFHVRKDQQVFRSAIPDLEDPDLEGYQPSGPRDKETGEFPFPDIGAISYGLETALTTTYRKGLRSEKVQLLPDEAAPLNFYMLFPNQMAPYIGTKRSGSLALDAMRGKETMAWMDAILALLGQIQEVNKTTHIVLLKVQGGNLAANISLTDYLNGLVLPGTGIGDMLIDLGNYGFNDLEFTPEIYVMLQSKIAVYQAQIINMLNALRESIPQIPQPRPNPMLPIETTNILDAYIRQERILVKSLKEFEAQNPTLKMSDVARVAHFLKYYSDYWQATVGRQEALLIEERNRTIKTEQLQLIQDEETIKRNKAERGLPPTPNTCEHVAKLTAIRRIDDEKERYKALTKFLAHYQGARREDNWITCNVCQKELLCVHERLLIKAFLMPLEKELIFKDINLHFSGGVMQGYYICRSCGQPIQEIGYDTSLEFDDKTGRPKIGRSVLQGDDSLTENDVERIMALPMKKAEDYEFEGDKMAYYKIIRELAERVGIYMDRKGYKRVIKNVEKLLSLYPSQEKFNAREKKMKDAAESKGEKYRKLDYHVVLSKTTISAAAILLLYEIQSHIPDYVPHYSLPGCDAGFGGFPLEEDRENKQGLTYMACAIAVISKNEDPWLSAGLYKPVKGGDKRDQIKSILDEMEGPLGNIQRFLSLDQQLIDKRIWKMQQLGPSLSSRPKDVVPASFLPELVLPTVAEAAGESKELPDARAVARAWIRNAHEAARKHSKPVRGSPFADITCCKIPITNPGAFWKDDLSPVPLGGRSLRPLQRAPFQQFHFVERPKDVLLAEIPQDLTYRLYMSVCYKGDRIGLPHEPGYTNLCHSCGFQFPTHPSIVDPDEAKTAILKQEIDTSIDSFQDLLTIVHNHHQVAPYSLGDVEAWPATLEALRTVSYEPIERWSRRFGKTIKALNELKSKNMADTASIASAIAEFKLDEDVTTVETFVKEVFGSKVSNPKALQKYISILETIAALPWHNFVQVLETYFLKVGKNLLFRFESARLNTFSNEKLAPDTLEKIKQALNVDNSVLNAFFFDFNSKSKRVARAKMRKFVLQLSEIVHFKNRIRPLYFVGGEDQTFQYLQRAFFYGPLAELFDPNMTAFETEIEDDLPGYESEDDDEEEEETISKAAKRDSALGDAIDESTTFLVKIIASTITNFNNYSISYNDDELKQILAERAEKEKQGMLTSIEAMTPEEYRIYQLQMKLKIGRFGVNVKKSIIGYSIEQIELEARLNEQAGITTSLSGPNFMDNMKQEGWEEEGGEEDDEDARNAAEAYDYDGALEGADEFDGEDEGY